MSRVRCAASRALNQLAQNYVSTLNQPTTLCTTTHHVPYLKSVSWLGSLGVPSEIRNELLERGKLLGMRLLGQMGRRQRCCCCCA